LVPFLALKDTGHHFFLFSIVSGITTGILTTSLLRVYLRKRITFDRFRWKEALWIAGAITVGSFLYGFLNFIAGFFYAKWVPVDNQVVKAFLENYNSFWLIIINSYFLITGWVLLYLSIKLLLKLNRDRLERLELNASLKQAQLNTLKGQINPHFMFNSLNNIRGLMLEDVERSREMLTKLSEMLRYSLTQNDTNAIALCDEIEMVEHYVDLSRIQLEDRLRFTREIDPRTLEVRIPPMVVQLLVENAVKHGISNRIGGGEIRLKTELLNGELLIEVANTGTFQVGGDSTQVGLNNIRQRLKLLYGPGAFFRLYQNGAEVVAEIKIPLT
jgi:LytS/YehU family sensor histidine kinase